MEIDNEQLRQVFEGIWTTVLGLEILPAGSKAEEQKGRGGLTGCVQMTGAWEGDFVINLSENLSKKIASIMFQKSPSDVTPDDMRDAVGEISNIVGGNLKALVPGPSTLLIPVVTAGVDDPVRVEGSEIIAQAFFLSEGETIAMTVVKKNVA